MKNKKVLIGITGGIAAYKICDLINILRKEGVNVKVIMTESAEKFITPLTIQTLTSNPVYTELFINASETEVEHIALAEWADLIVVAPASANTIGKVANGISDNLLTTVIMAISEKTPIIIAPAMNTNMWNNKIVKENIRKLKNISKQYIFINPKIGRLACGDYGEGPLAEIESIISIIKKYA